MRFSFLRAGRFSDERQGMAAILVRKEKSGFIQYGWRIVVPAAR